MSELENSVSISELILNNYTLYFAVIWISTLVVVGVNRCFWLVTTCSLVFLHLWVNLIGRILPDNQIGALGEICGILCLLVLQILPQSSIILFAVSYLIIRLLGYGRYIVNLFDFVVYKKRDPQDINDLCVPVMFVTVVLYYLKQHVGWQN
jgi:hypothetical protein